MLFLLCMTNHLQAGGRNLLGWKNTTGNARSPATPLSSRAVLASPRPCSQRDAELWLWELCCSLWTPEWHLWVWGVGSGAGQAAGMGGRRGVAGRGKLCGGTAAPSQLPASRDSSCRENSGEQMVKHPTRESRSHPFPVPPTAPDTSKFPELIDYQGRISILLNYNLALVHVFTLYLFRVGN